MYNYAAAPTLLRLALLLICMELNHFRSYRSLEKDAKIEECNETGSTFHLHHASFQARMFNPSAKTQVPTK
jgi:hypothetical protein